jgi:hypothetical protein
VHWILQDNIYDEDGWRSLLETLERFEIPHSLHKVIPFIGEIDPDVDPEGKVVCMGTYSLRHLAKKKGWTPGVWDIADQTFLVQKEHWGEHMLNYDSVVVEFQNASFWQEQQFVRPIDDTKVFAGKVFNREAFDEWRKRVCDLNLQDNGSELTPDTLVQVCDPKEIYGECRCWVVKGQVVTSSIYKIGSRVVYVPGQSPLITKFVEDRISEWEPHEAFVIDVADTPEGLKVIEINTLNSSGYYAADMQKLVMAIEEAF